MTEPAAHAQDIPAVQPAEEWKPEPRQWAWRDLFTAPMLAFKPKCMLVSALTLLALGAWMWAFNNFIFQENPGFVASIPGRMMEWLWYLVALVIFSLGAGLVAVFMKADLLDDEFLSFGEAIAQYQPRILSAVLVPVFLCCLLAATYLLMVWVPVFVLGIPWGIGSTIYALLYPLGFLASLFVVLLGIAVWLSVFVFPAIIAIRRHGWFDNVVDTVEAVGTKPHLLVGSLLLTCLMMFIAHAIGFAGMDQLKTQYRSQPGFKISEGVTWNEGTRMAEAGANDMVNPVANGFHDHILRRFDQLHLRDTLREIALFPPRPSYLVLERGGWDFSIAGTILGCWQVLIAALILGYLMNLFVAGGMLSYLVVREDDYWDDEDLEDLDKLAKELEEEAKREQAAETGGAPGTEPAKPAADAAEPPKPTT